MFPPFGKRDLVRPPPNDCNKDEGSHPDRALAAYPKPQKAPNFRVWRQFAFGTVLEYPERNQETRCEKNKNDNDCKVNAGDIESAHFYCSPPTRLECRWKC